MTQGSCIFEGCFGEINVPDVLTFLDMLGKTGTLEVQRDQAQRRLHWEHGQIIFADSTLDHETLPGWLLRNGRVGPEALEEARKVAPGEDEVVGELVKMGELDPALLPRAIRALVLDIIYSLFEWSEGRFRFLVTAEPHDEKVVLRTSVSNTIMEGSRRLDEWRRIREMVPDDDVHPIPASGEAPASVKLSPVEEEILGLVDGRSRVSDIVRQVDHDQFTTLSAIHALATTGYVSITTEAAAESADRGGNGLSREESSEAAQVVQTFNNIFAGLHDCIVRVKGDSGHERYAATLKKQTFQRAGVFAGVQFAHDGRLPLEPVLQNVAQLPDEQRLSRLRGSMDRLLAQQVLQMDAAHTQADKQAISELISREKDRLASPP